ncbi:MAG: hypothetical protein OEZ01_06160 [Candidatus Heimdallarchaeota archaeon]|nr:hypothetical protein [Candidatus Heimdallarchaeota archaeon]MDH5645571.1 hypothetical protein [Candidatus Heimdallarchaeota archaeon]
MNKQTTLDVLISLGLTLGEAKTYLALVSIENSEASPLAEIADVPQTKIYAYLKSLEQNHKIVRKVEIIGKPNQYSALDFDIVVSKLQADLVEKIQHAKEYVSNLQTPNEQIINSYVYTIQGERSLKLGLEDICLKAKENILIISSGNTYFVDIMEQHMKTRDIKKLQISDLFHKPSKILNIISKSDIFKQFSEMKFTTFFVDINIDNKSCQSVNILGYPNSIDQDPILVSINHPSIINFQMTVIKTMVNILETFDFQKLLEY